MKVHVSNFNFCIQIKFINVNVIYNLIYYFNIDIVSFGQPNIQCEYCLAKVWYEERSFKTKSCLKVDFSICCQKGKVQLPFLQQSLKLMLELLNGQDPQSQHYLQHIRSYNSMFSFTSIGGKV